MFPATESTATVDTSSSCGTAGVGDRKPQSKDVMIVRILARWSRKQSTDGGRVEEEVGSCLAGPPGHPHPSITHSASR